MFFIQAAENVELPFKALITRKYTTEELLPLLDRFTKFTYDVHHSRTVPYSFDNVYTMEEIRFLVREFGALAEFLQHDLYTFLDSNVKLEEEFTDNPELITSLQSNKISIFEEIVQPYLSFLPDCFMYMPHAAGYQASIEQANILRQKYEILSTDSPSLVLPILQNTPFEEPTGISNVVESVPSTMGDSSSSILCSSGNSNTASNISIIPELFSAVVETPSLPGYIPPSTEDDSLSKVISSSSEYGTTPILVPPSNYTVSDRASVTNVSSTSINNPTDTTILSSHPNSSNNPVLVNTNASIGSISQPLTIVSTVQSSTSTTTEIIPDTNNSNNNNETVLPSSNSLVSISIPDNVRNTSNTSAPEDTNKDEKNNLPVLLPLSSSIPTSIDSSNTIITQNVIITNNHTPSIVVPWESDPSVVPVVSTVPVNADSSASSAAVSSSSTTAVLPILEPPSPSLSSASSTTTFPSQVPESSNTTSNLPVGNDVPIHNDNPS